jgi:hypothetical protein
MKTLWEFMLSTVDNRPVRSSSVGYSPKAGSILKNAPHPAVWLLAECRGWGFRAGAMGCTAGDARQKRNRRGRLPKDGQGGSLESFLKPELTPGEREVAGVEGWILGVL